MIVREVAKLVQGPEYDVEDRTIEKNSRKNKNAFTLQLLFFTRGHFTSTC